VNSEKALRSITELIVQCCNPEAVLLFGSYARRQERLESDIDILVIGSFRESPHLRGQEVRELLHRYPVRIDLHLVTAAELARESDNPYGFPGSVLATCLTLYRRAETGH
jgi:predicted nucleotidyltransferase